MSIQRYNVDDRGRPITPTRSGYWVKFKDHAAALAAQAERVKVLEKELAELKRKLMLTENERDSWRHSVRP